MTPQRRAGLVCWILAATLATILGLRGFSLSFSLEREVWWLKASGYLALSSLFLSLSMTPALRFQQFLAMGGIPKASWLAFRRSFGITAAVFGTLHAALVWTTYLGGSWRVLFASAYLRAGLVSLVILLALAVTSFPRLTRRLRVGLWRELHRLSYVAALFLAQHLLLSPFAPKGRSLWLCVLLVVILSLRALPGRSPFRPKP